MRISMLCLPVNMPALGDPVGAHSTHTGKPNTPQTEQANPCLQAQVMYQHAGLKQPHLMPVAAAHGCTNMYRMVFNT